MFKGGGVSVRRVPFLTREALGELLGGSFPPSVLVLLRKFTAKRKPRLRLNSYNRRSYARNLREWLSKMADFSFNLVERRDKREPTELWLRSRKRSVTGILFLKKIFLKIFDILIQFFSTQHMVGGEHLDGWYV